jgi:hypothetical protein
MPHPTTVLALLVARAALPAAVEAAAPGTSEVQEVAPHFEPADCWFDTAAIEAGPIRGGYVQVPEDRVEDPTRRPPAQCLNLLPERAISREPPERALAARPSGDTVRFTIIINGHRQGERRAWQEAPGTYSSLRRSRPGSQARLRMARRR